MRRGRQGALQDQGRFLAVVDCHPGAEPSAPGELHRVPEGQRVGPGAFRVRVTAWDGQTLEDELPGPNAEAIYEGKGQFQ